MILRNYSPNRILRCSIKLSQCGAILLLAGCASFEEAPPPAGRLADEERLRRERPWPNLVDVPAEPRPGSSPAAIAALRAQLEAERAAHDAACPPGRADRGGKCME